MVRALLVGISAWTGLLAVPATAPGELALEASAREARPVILIEHSMESASPFSQAVILTGDGGGTLPSVPATSGGTVGRGRVATPSEATKVPVVASPRWQPETRLEPAVRPSTSPSRTSSGGMGIAPVIVKENPRLPTTSGAEVYPWRTIEPTTQLKPNTLGVSPPVASSGVPVLVEPASSVGVPTTTSSHVVWSAPAPPVYRGQSGLPTTPAAPYAIGGVAPQLPPGKAQSRYVAKGLWGDSKTYVEGQPIRNFGRFLTLPSHAGR